MYCDKERLKCIWNRENVPKRLFSLKKALNENNMDQYYTVCVNRILDTGIANDCIYISRNFDEIRLCDDGIFIFKEILSGYLGEEFLIDSYKELSKINKNITYENDIYEAFRKMKFLDVLKLIISKNNSSCSSDAIKKVKLELIFELLSRNPVNLIRIKALKNIQFMINKLILNIEFARIAV